MPVRQEQQCYQLYALSPGHVLRYYRYYYGVLRTRIFVTARLLTAFVIMKGKPRVLAVGNRLLLKFSSSIVLNRFHCPIPFGTLTIGPIAHV